MQFHQTLGLRFGALVIGLGASLGVSSCNDTSLVQGSQLPVNSVQDLPGAAGRKFIVDPSSNGQATTLRLLRTEWGRLVDVYVFEGDPAITPRTLWFSDFLIDPNIQSDSDYLLERLPASGRETLTIRHGRTTGAELANFQRSLDALDDGLQFFVVKSLNPNELPPFTAVARNAAVRLVFDDLLDPATITPATVGLRTGYPPTLAQGARVFADGNYGDLRGGVFRSTRVVLDLTISQEEAPGLGLSVNSLGLPDAVTTSQGNATLRIPTRVFPGVVAQTLTNLNGTRLGFTGNGATDNTSPGLDVVRVFRSGGRTSVTGDPNNGFLSDSIQPRVVSQLNVSLQNVLTIAANRYIADVVFPSAACALTPRVGDIVALPTGVFLQVTQDGSSASGNTATNVNLQLVDTVGGTAVPEGSTAQYRQPWTGGGIGQTSPPECWVLVQPTPASPPFTGIATNSTFTVQFTEPVNPATMSGFDNFQLLYPNSPDGEIQSRVAGAVSFSSDLTRFTFQPRIPLRHVAAQSELYRINLRSGADGVRDLAGNQLGITLPTTTDFSVLPAAAGVDSGSITLRFSSTDEDAGPGNTPAAPEFRGQITYDLLNGRIRPRSVQRISGVFEPQSASARLMPGPDVNTVPPLTQTNGTIIGVAMNPLTRLGARTMTLWRHFDLGFSIGTNLNPPTVPATFNYRSFNEATFNLDVEGLWWSPSASGVLVDNFPEFEMRLSHSLFLPDETLLGMPPAIVHPNSGVSATFAENLLDPVNDPQQTVHPRGRGYTINPIEQIQSANGTVLAPWPLNRGVPQSQYNYFTWRDTSVTSVGQPDNGAGTGQGVLTGNEAEALINDFTLNVDPIQTIYGLGAVPTIGLPLLMDIRCYPNSTSSQSNLPNGRAAAAVPLNQYPQAFALEALPFFTAYSGGAVTTTGILQPIDPDTEIIARGTNPPGGANSLPRNQVMLYGQGDFVVRVNRAHSRWFRCSPVAGGTFSFAEPILEPAPSELPAGTQVLLHFRGATGVTTFADNTSVPANAESFDPYGDRSPLNATPAFAVTFTNADPSWKSNITEIDGSFFFQTRITMISNVESGATPEVSGLGFSFFR
ncbi:MAG: Ig-like domain-containing protein [Planctomycetes bacterium]|nr:Ig-like domain-containing protein [Planctomycetota bacterium]